ncbi:MAG: branched-chain amino acid ABC transporter permease [Nanoarchaeota archaeon]
MPLLAQLTVNGIIAGSIYALVASGFALIYGTNKFMHFAHGASVTFAGYILFLLLERTIVPFYGAIIITIIFTSYFGLLLYRFVYLPLQNRKASTVILLVASIALLILFENTLQVAFGPEVKTIPYDFDNRTFTIFGGTITILQIFIFITALLIFLFLFAFMRYSNLGKAMRAVADNKELAAIWGIDSRKIADMSFLIGSFLAGVAGILIGLEQSLVPTMGTMLIIKGFTGAVIGGIAYVPASVIGSYVLGFAENYGVALLPSGYKDAIGFVILFLFLLLKPEGLFGVPKGVKSNA